MNGTDIVLATINARYHHASLGLRYLYANLGALRGRTTLREFTLEWRPAEIAERILSLRPRVVGLGVYIWNVSETGELAALIKAVDPRCIVVMGGPEVGFEDDLPDAARHADYVVAGQGDFAFRDLCLRLLAGDAPADRFIRASNPPLDQLVLPYGDYDAEDIAHRMIYVEASRGCPFKCEFCLSALDRTAWHFDLDRVLAAFDGLYRRGVRHFKFVDRTFNLKRRHVERILDFFLDLEDDGLFLHFELIPDRLPDAVKPRLQRFAPGTLQFEIGIQTFAPHVQAIIDRRQDEAATAANLEWLKTHTHAHVHADLIFGLPGEDLASFARGFDRLFALAPDEIQVGILKRLRGTPMTRRELEYDLRFNPAPPYNVLSTDRVDFATVQRVSRFARYFDMIANSGRFAATLALFGRGSLFDRFLVLSDWLYDTTGRTHRIALPRLFELLDQGLVARLGMDRDTVRRALAEDFARGGFKGAPPFLDAARASRESIRSAGHGRRQARHVAARRAGATR